MCEKRDKYAFEVADAACYVFGNIINNAIRYSDGDFEVHLEENGKITFSNTANKLTMLRVVMIPAFMLVLYMGFPGANYVALVIFALASITDWLDGYVARHYNQTTDFGKFMDPLADKCLVTAAMLWFVEVGQMPAWALLTVIVREFAISGLRMNAATSGRVIAAGWSGKVKTASTMVCIVVMFLPIPAIVNTVCVWIIALTTLYSGVEYFAQNWKCMMD